MPKKESRDTELSPKEIADSSELSYEEYIIKLDDTLREFADLHLNCDVPLGVCLSSE